jgi:hypothetical protein
VPFLQKGACCAERRLGDLGIPRGQLDCACRATADVQATRQTEIPKVCSRSFDVCAGTVEIAAHRLEPTEPDGRVRTRGLVATVLRLELSEPRDSFVCRPGPKIEG